MCETRDLNISFRKKKVAGDEFYSPAVSELQHYVEQSRSTGQPFGVDSIVVLKDAKENHV